MFTILGYTSEISVAPGEALTCHVSAEDGRRYFARLVRVINGDCNPDGPGLNFEHVPSAIEGWYVGRPQRTDAGSFMVARELSGIAGGLAFVATIWPTLPARRQRQVVACYAGPGGGFTLSIESGALTLEVTGAGRVQRSALPPGVLLERHWYRVTCAIDPARRELLLEAVPLRDFPLAHGPLRRTAELSVPVELRSGGDFHLAGAPMADGTVDDHFNGKIESPTLRDDPAAGGAVIAAWDFSRDMAGARAIDTGPRLQHGTLVNLPARAMTGWRWSGEVHDWRQCPEQYGAVHFHHDDLYDAGWETAFTLAVPPDMPSGAYAVHVKCGENSEYETNEDYIPFFVRPPRRKAERTARPKLLFLAPTNSYLAYANDSQALMDRGAEQCMGRLLNLQHADIYLHRHPELCASLYDKHADGSGVCHSSRLRPVLNMRPRYHSWLGNHGSALYQYNGDTHILAWLEHEGVAFDVATDEDLHQDGFSLLEGYTAVITGTHPEYHSTPMWDAMHSYLAHGGRLIYMGGNGWYWRVAFHPMLPGVIEVRRAEGGTRTWEAQPGEYHHGFNGELGGLWRRIGRPPNLLVGVGFVAQGFDLSGFFRRRPGSHELTRRLHFRRRGGGGDRRFRPGRRRGRGSGAGRLQPAPRLAAPRAGAGHLREPYAADGGHAGGVPGVAAGAGRRPERQGAGGHGALRDRKRRCCVLHRFDRLGGIARLERLRQQRPPHHRQRAAPLPRPGALRTTPLAGRRRIITLDDIRAAMARIER